MLNGNAAPFEPPTDLETLTINFRDTLHLHDTNASGGINTNRIVLTDNGSSTTILIDNPINVLDRTIILDGVSGFADLNAAVAAGWLVFS
jgi:hypothetical protein